jgi:nucleoside-diphosphate-sugar epimerase
MVAGALKEMTGWENDILFSSGVSNSGEQSVRFFQREIDLVNYFLSRANGSTFVYFSTTSIFDSAKAASPYVNHKIFIEDLIKNSSVNYLIVRLPNLVGNSNNPNTLTNFFVDRIRMRRAIKLNFHAIRHLIDVTDLPFILNDISTQYGKKNVTVDVETDRPLTADKILSMIEQVLDIEADIQHIDAKTISTINNSELKKSAVYYQLKTNDDYHYNLLKKYYTT